ncbi:MAG TPA: 3-hydroxyacyl-CoA dehydrogenase NAD-binding domain-containing protein, partial [Candidatus Eisenbacteria bacterium]
MTIHSIAVLGAGIMGRGIAYAAALGGHRTVLHDTRAEALDQAKAEIASLLEKGVAGGKVPGEAAAAARERLSTVRGLVDAARGADLVIE